MAVTDVLAGTPFSINTLPIEANPTPKPAPKLPETPDLQAQELEAYKQKGELEKLKDEAVLKKEKETAEAQAKTTADYAKAVTEDPTRKLLGEKVKERADTTFVPTKETAADMGLLFTLTNIVGFMIGGKSKGNAQQAMSAMNGMLEGHQKGREDLYKKEKAIFEENTKALDKTIEALDRQFKEAMQIYAVDREAGMATAQSAIAEHNATFLGDALKKNGLAYSADLLSKAVSQKDKKELAMQKLKQREEDIKRQERHHQEQMKQQKELAEIKAQTARGGAGGVIQFRYNGAVATAADKLGIHLENLSSAASTSEVPRVGDVLTSERTVPTAMIKYFATTLTEPQNRALQQELAPTIREIANIESAGRPGGVTQASVNELGKMAPVGGDQKINYYMFLALAKQEAAIAKTTLEVSGGTKEQIDAAQKAIDKINKVVSWDVKDINRILTGPDGNTLVNDKMQNMLARSNGLDQFNTFVEQQKINGGAETQSSIDPTTGYPTINARGYVLKRDKNGAYAYVSPDGKTFEEIQ